eukprot:scaffold9941_cov116-Isochrysis_galbana.AAC.10
MGMGRMECLPPSLLLLAAYRARLGTEWYWCVTCHVSLITHTDVRRARLASSSPGPRARLAAGAQSRRSQRAERRGRPGAVGRG